MKKTILVFVAIAFVAMAATTFPSISNAMGKKSVTSELANTNYKSCIEACNACASECNSCASMCIKDKDAVKMAHCTQLSLECAALCTASAQLMSLGSENAKDVCAQCAKLCEKCAAECDKFTMECSKECASSCRKAAKQCKDM